MTNISFRSNCNAISFFNILTPSKHFDLIKSHNFLMRTDKMANIAIDKLKTKIIVILALESSKTI